MSKLSELQNKLQEIDALMALIENSEKELYAEKQEALELEEKAMEEALPSNKICDVESKEMAQQVLGFSDDQMLSEKVEILGKKVVAINSDYGYAAAIRIKKTVYTQSKTYDVEVSESSDGRRGSGSYSETSGASKSFQEVWEYVSLRFSKFHELAREIGKQIELVKKEMAPSLQAKKKAIAKSYNLAFIELHNRKEALKALRAPVMQEEHEIRSKEYAMEQALAVQNMGDWEDSPY